MAMVTIWTPGPIAFGVPVVLYGCHIVVSRLLAVPGVLSCVIAVEIAAVIWAVALHVSESVAVKAVWHLPWWL